MRVAQRRTVWKKEPIFRQLHQAFYPDNEVSVLGCRKAKDLLDRGNYPLSGTRSDYASASVFWANGRKSASCFVGTRSEVVKKTGLAPGQLPKKSDEYPSRKGACPDFFTASSRESNDCGFETCEKHTESGKLWRVPKTRIPVVGALSCGV